MFKLWAYHPIFIPRRLRSATTLIRRLSLLERRRTLLCPSAHDICDVTAASAPLPRAGCGRANRRRSHGRHADTDRPDRQTSASATPTTVPLPPATAPSRAITRGAELAMLLSAIGRLSTGREIDGAIADAALQHDAREAGGSGAAAAPGRTRTSLRALLPI
jgi:hypothetical protein